MKRFVITILVMTIPELSASDEYAIYPVEQGLQDIDRINRARAHHPHDPNVRRVLETRGSSQISASIGTPVAKKSHYFGFEFSHMVLKIGDMKNW
jgi:hypothetical protein